MAARKSERTAKRPNAAMALPGSSPPPTKATATVPISTALVPWCHPVASHMPRAEYRLRKYRRLSSLHDRHRTPGGTSEEHTSELQSLMIHSYAFFFLHTTEN